MGLFHCPMGAPFYDDEACIDCGMCSAATREEMVEASSKIRAYLRSHARNNRAVNKIAVCGKGGAGKSTVVTLMANALIKEGYGVLVLDADESNPGLSRMFGFDREPKLLMTLLSGLPSGASELDPEWFKRDKIFSQDIPAEYEVHDNGLKLLMVGKIIDPFQGCACSMADITRDFMAKLVLKDREVVLVDMEAGIESFGRGVERSVDMVLIVVEPSFQSLALAEKIGYMAAGMGISRVRAILNRIPSEEVRQTIIDDLTRRGIQSIGTIYLDPQIGEAGLKGTALGDSRAMSDMRAITSLLLREFTGQRSDKQSN